MGLGLSLGLRLAGQASPRPSFLAGNEYWGFTASPTPQFAHFGRSTNKAGALASTRNSESYNLAGTQLFPANDPVVSAVAGLEGWAGYEQLFQRFDDFGNAYWSRVNTTVPVAGRLQETTATGEHGVQRNFQYTSGAWVCVYFDIAAAERTKARLRVVAAQGQADIDLMTGALSNQAAGGINILTPTYHSFALPGGGWRVAIVFQAGTVLNINVGCFILNDAGDVSYAGDASKGIIVYRASNVLADRVFPPHPTTSAPATRAADNTTIPDWQVFVERYSLLDGLTIDATVNIRLTPAAARRILTIGTANDGFFLEQTTSNTIRAVLRASSADVWTMTSGAIGADGNRRVQVTLKPGANALTVEGVSGASNSNATALPDAIRTEPAYVGRDIAGSLHWDGNIPSFKIGKAG